MIAEKIYAPWTPEQVDRLNEYQRAGRSHPFTGPRSVTGEEMPLIATVDGWIGVPGGPVVQTWAWDWMAK